jgi:hypothetical protein
LQLSSFIGKREAEHGIPYEIKILEEEEQQNTNQSGCMCVHQGSTDLRYINVMLFCYITPISHAVYNKKETFHASNIHNVEYNRIEYRTAGT